MDGMVDGPLLEHRRDFRDNFYDLLVKLLRGEQAVTKDYHNHSSNWRFEKILCCTCEVMPCLSVKSTELCALTGMKQEGTHEKLQEGNTWVFPTALLLNTTFCSIL